MPHRKLQRRKRDRKPNKALAHDIPERKKYQSKMMGSFLPLHPEPRPHPPSPYGNKIVTHIMATNHHSLISFNNTHLISSPYEKTDTTNVTIWDYTICTTDTFARMAILVRTEQMTHQHNLPASINYTYVEVTPEKDAIKPNRLNTYSVDHALSSCQKLTDSSEK